MLAMWAALLLNAAIFARCHPEFLVTPSHPGLYLARLAPHGGAGPRPGFDRGALGLRARQVQHDGRFIEEDD